MTGAAAAWAAGLLGAWFALDDAVCVSLLVAEPLFAGAIFGAATGRFEAGVACGALLQCVWIATLRVGGARPPEGWLGAVAAVSAAPAGLTLDGGAWLAAGSLAPALVWGVACAYAGMWSRTLLGRWIGHHADRAVGRAANGALGAIETLHAGAVGMHAARGAVLALAAAAAGPVVAACAARTQLWAPAGWIALALACVALARNSGRTARWTWAAGGVAGLLWACT